MTRLEPAFLRGFMKRAYGVYEHDATLERFNPHVYGVPKANDLNEVIKIIREVDRRAKKEGCTFRVGDEQYGEHPPVEEFIKKMQKTVANLPKGQQWDSCSAGYPHYYQLDYPKDPKSPHGYRHPVKDPVLETLKRYIPKESRKPI